MKRKICLGLSMLLLLLPLTVFFVQGETTDASQWAVINYAYDPDVEGEAPKTGTVSFAKNAKNYLRRYTTLTWDPQTLEVQVAYKSGTVQPLLGQGACRITKAGEYVITVKNASGESASCILTMLPVVKVGGNYLSSNANSGEFWNVSFNYFPVVECENVDRMELDTKLGGENVNDKFMSGMLVDSFGRHSLTFISAGYAVTAYFDVFVCLAEKTMDEELGKYTLVLSVGDFGADTSVYLDNSAVPLTPGQHKITGVGQHTLTAKQYGMPLKNATPAPQALNMQVQILMDDLVVEEPTVLPLSRWDAVFYADGRRIEGDYRVASSGKTVLTAYDQNGKQIENAFVVQKSATEAGTVYTELELTFENPHRIYAIILIVPALAMIVAAGVFCLRRRRIV